MIDLSVGAYSLAHGVHYGIVVLGMLGMLALLGPQWVGAPKGQGPRDDHERRIASLQEQIAAGSLGTATRSVPKVSLRREAGAILPIAIVSSAAAAGVHAAVGPSHFQELPLFGLFFTAAAIAQLTWALLMVLNPTRRLLLIGVVGNAAIIVLWLSTRIMGLPFGLMPTPEAIGLWDVCCAAWEGLVVIAGLKMLKGHGAKLRFPAYDDWPSSARLWMVGSMLVLGVLTVSGSHA